jgi:biopolymer transport protein ExbD
MARRRREFVDNLNLVPFIDLFSTMIIFLLSTAVWDQLAGIQANVASGSGGAEIHSTELTQKVQANVKVTVTNDYIETFDAGSTRRYERQGHQMDYNAVGDFLKDARERYLDKRDIVIEASDNAKYEDLVAVMDLSLGQKFTDIVVKGLVR